MILSKNYTLQFTQYLARGVWQRMNLHRVNLMRSSWEICIFYQLIRSTTLLDPFLKSRLLHPSFFTGSWSIGWIKSVERLWTGFLIMVMLSFGCVTASLFFSLGSSRCIMLPRVVNSPLLLSESDWGLYRAQSEFNCLIVLSLNTICVSLIPRITDMTQSRPLLNQFKD
jgi:hypothetical protein